MSTKLDQSKGPDTKNDSKSALLAVSGGVDSIVLLHMISTKTRDTGSKNLQDFLAQNKLTKIEVAYVDHSQRDDTDLDIRAIQLIVDQFKIEFHTIKLVLPAKCSEQLARDARYEALEGIRMERGLNAIITAHHSDDVLETAVINLTRGTGPRGLSSLQHQPNGIWRPFLFNLKNKVYTTKDDLIRYARDNNLQWNEDSTNQSEDYLRNRIRSKLQNSNPRDKLQFLKVISENISVTDQIDQELESLTDSLRIDLKGEIYSTNLFKTLPEEIKDQFLHQKISQHGYDVSRDSVARAKEFIETKTTGKLLQLKGCHILILSMQNFSFYSVPKEKQD